MKVLVLSKNSFDQLMVSNDLDDSNVHSIKDTLFISINNNFDNSVKPHFSENKDNVLILHFDDVENDIYENNKLIAKSFTNEQGTTLLQFLEKNKNKSKCIVHCTAGISRSGAVGTFINDHYGTDTYDEFKKRNPYVHPNGQVLSVLNRIYREYEN